MGNNKHEDQGQGQGTVGQPKQQSDMEKAASDLGNQNPSDKRSGQNEQSSGNRDLGNKNLDDARKNSDEQNRNVSKE